MQKVSQHEEEAEWDVASFLQKWTFSVANKMLKSGMRKPLEFDDLMKIPVADKSSRLVKDLKYYLRRSKPWFIVPRLMVALIRMTWIYWPLIIAGTMIEGAIRIALPLVLIFLLRALEQNEARAAYGWAAVIAALGIGQAVSHHILFFFSMRVGWNWKNSCTALIYDSLFQLKGEQLQVLQSGRMVNLISNDVARFEEFAVFGIYTWESFLEMAVIILVLIYVLNIPAAFASLGASLLFVPPVLLFARKFALYRGQTAAATDQRVRRIGEVLEGVAQVKAYAWEQPFFAMISSFRAVEEASIARSQTLRALNQGLSFCTPPVVSLVTFVVYRVTGGELTIPIVFSTISLLQVLRMVIGRLWTRGIETGSEALASCIRIEAFLLHLYPEVSENELVGDIDKSIAHSHHNRAASTQQPPNILSTLSTDSIMSLVASQCYYSSVSSTEQTAVLTDINITITPGHLTMIVGSVGCGKSSLLNAILGELRLSNDGRRSIKDGVKIAYCSQRAWIAAASVKANIALAGTINTTEEGYNYKQPTGIDDELYATALESCLLVDDLNAWPAYDETEIGERGVSVSGGQKARISLARAVYSNADVFLFDDPLSAVDAHVGQALLNNCLLDTLRAKNKAIVLVTHQLQHLPRADEIIVLDINGKQVFAGDYDSLLQQKDIAASLLGGDHQREESSTNSPSKQQGQEIVQRPVSRYNKDFLVNRRVALQQAQASLAAAASKTAITNKTEEEEEEAKLETQAGKEDEIELTIIKEDNLITQQEAAAEEQRRKIISVEDRQVGSISFSVYWRYLTSGGTVRGVLVITFMLMSQAILMLTDYWPRFWAVEVFGPQDRALYPAVFAGLVVACISAGFLRALAFFAFSLRASSAMHARCFWAVLHSPLAFFVANPSGRILNRFSRDQNMTDELLPVTFFSFLEASIFCLGGIVVVCVSIPWLLLLMPPLIYAFSSLRTRYIISSREIRRWEAVTRSPLYSDFSATLEGLITLRAFDLRTRVTSLFLKQLDDNGMAWFSFLMVSRWLGFRLDMETSVILAFVAFFSVLLRSQIQVGLVALALVYVMSMSALLQWAVRQSTEVESQMTAVERINAYSELPPEPGYSSSLTDFHHHHGVVNSSSQHQVKKAMSSNKEKDLLNANKGHLELKQLTVRYRPDLDPVLKQVTLDIPSGYKVGICGRTGSGKSSTLLALLRLNLVSGGDIILDGQSLLKMDLESARSQFALIPQEPALFSGTVRFNLDPFRRHSDMEIWDALEDAHFAVYLKQQTLGLDSVVEEGGKNFSVGQRQLLSLARAILRRCQVILMDEVTASIDFQTDRLLQQTIRESDALRQATIITVAHRLRTIADYDMIVVIDAGRVAECGSPSQLLQTAGSLYLALAEQSGELSEIQAAAQRVAAAVAEKQ